MTEMLLREDLASLDEALRARLALAGFDAEHLVRLARHLFERASDARADTDRNRIQGLVAPPAEGDLLQAPVAGNPGYDGFVALGRSALIRGEVAFCVMAGGMATRMGGIVKALVEVIDGLSFLDLRLRENAAWSRRLGRPVPLWLMTSAATDAPIRSALQESKAPPHVATFEQDISVRLTPEGRLFRRDDGGPSIYAPGHGDLPDALRRSGLLSKFVAAGGRTVWIANIDNLGATIDEALLGQFLQQDCDVEVELAAKKPGDRGGIPAWAEVGLGPDRGTRRLQILEEFRLPVGFDASAVPVFNTNTFLTRADTLMRKEVMYHWFQVKKTVDGRSAIQFERLLQELTAAMKSKYVCVPRDGAASRFLPIKDFDELAHSREQIRAVAFARGML